MIYTANFEKGRQPETTAKIKMCKLESIKWAVVKSNKMISKSLSKNLNNIRNGSTQENTFSFYYFEEKDLKSIVELLNSYKKLSFEVVRFYDKQFGLTLNHWGGDSKNQLWFEEKVSKMPLSHKFSWFNNDNRVSITPISSKQFNNIIKIN